MHLAAERVVGGDIAIRWVRRSRSGWAWVSGSDTPLGEESETYRVVVTSAGSARAATIAGPQLIYTAAEQAEDGLAGPLSISVTQLGTLAASQPARLTIRL